jgi:hypothetical protein
VRVALKIRLYKQCELHGLCLPVVNRVHAVAASQVMFVRGGKTYASAKSFTAVPSINLLLKLRLVFVLALKAWCYSLGLYRLHQQTVTVSQ